MSPSRTTRLLWLPCALVLAPGASEASGAVAFRADSCGSSTTASVTVARPAGLEAGDLMLMSVIHEGSDFDASPPSGWTVVSNGAYAADSDDRSVLFRRTATASDPASWTISSPDSNAMAVAVNAFSGVDPAQPFSGGVARTTGTTTRVPLPTATALRDGSMQWSSVGHWPAYGQTGRTTTFDAGLTETCDRQGDGSFGQVVGMATAYEPVGQGATPSRSATMSAAPSRWTASTLVLNPPPGPCADGTLALTSPSTVSFPSFTLTGADATLRATEALRVEDGTDATTGWSISATSTRFTSGARTLAADATTVASASAAPAPGNCALPDNGVPLPVTLPAGDPAPAATKLFASATGPGVGPVDIGFDFDLALPARTYAGTYTAQWTFTLAASP